MENVSKFMARESNSQRRMTALFIFALGFLIYSLTLARRFYGYEDSTLAYIRELLYNHQTWRHTPAGILDCLAYLPAEVISNILVSPTDYTLRDFISLQTLPITSALICLVFYALALDLYRSARVAVSITLLLAFTTMLWPYSKMGMELQHTLWILFSVWMIVRWEMRSDRVALALAGLGAGMVVLTKLYGFVSSAALIIFVFYAALADSDRRRRLTSVFLYFLPPLVLVGALFFIHNRLRFGSWFLGSRYNLGYEAKTVQIWQPLWGFFFSSGKGIFIYNPVLIISVFYITAFFRRFGRLKVLFLLMIGLGLLFHSLFWIWTDETWGPRKLHYMIPLAVLPLGLMVEEFRRMSLLRRLGIITIVLLGIFVQILGVAVSYEAQPDCLKWQGLSSLEDLRYNPRLSHTTFNYALLESIIDRYITGEPHYFIYKPTHFATTLPPGAKSRSIGINLKNFSWFDFWFMDNRPLRKGGFFLNQPLRIYASFLIILIPLLFFALYLSARRVDGVSVPWMRTASGWTLFFISLAGLFLCIAYNRAYSRDRASFTNATPPIVDFAIGDDTRDEPYLGWGWRASEWMKDPLNPKYQVPFRWTTLEESAIFLPCKPHTSYKLALDVIFVYKGRLTIWANGRRVLFVRGGEMDRRKLEVTVPAGIIGDYHVCNIVIQCHDLHIPAREKPESSKDISVLGLIVYGLSWREYKNN